MQMRRDLPALEDASTTLINAGDARRRLEVADIGLDRSDHKRLIGIASVRKDGAECADLDRIAERSARAVRLDITDGTGSIPATSSAARITASCAGPLGAVSPPLRPSWLTALPRTTARMRSPSARASRESPQHDDAAALAAHISVGRGVEGLAPAIRRHHPRLREADVHLGRQNEIDAAGQRQVALAEAQALTRQMQRNQRRRTGGVDRDARPMQAEEVRQPAGSDAVGIARAEIGVDQVRVSE